MPQKTATRFSRLAPRLRIPSILLAGAFAASLALPTAPVAAQGLAGAFLAARQAGLRNDFEASSDYLEQVLVADPDNGGTLEALTLSLFSEGEREVAGTYANRLVGIAPESRISALVLLAQGFAGEDYVAAEEIAGSGSGLHPLVIELARGWALMGQGSVGDALAVFDAAAENPDLRVFALYCKSLALALVGDVEGALEIIEAPDSGVVGSLNRRGYLAYAQLLGLNERYDDGRTLLSQVFGQTRDPMVAGLDAAFEQGQALPFSLISSASGGMAEVFAVMTNAMFSAGNSHEALLYAQATLWVNPDLGEVQIQLGQVYEALERPQLAEPTYAAVTDDSPFAMAAQMGRAQVLETLGNRDEAIALIEELTRTHADTPIPEQVLGDFLRRDGDYERASQAYSRAFDIMEATGTPIPWSAYFARAVSYERTDRWDLAEADLRAALAIEPSQSSVLNYLGYSLVERGADLDEALDMIEQAVALEPESGVIVDSLAWALFRLGRYHIALPHMERAVSLSPSEPVLNDHLGDLYWAVGRQREARFQWRRALSFPATEDLDADRVRRKLEVGLDVVLEDEGVPPLNATN